MFEFKVTCFKEDIGIFTAYGAKVKTNAPSPIGPRRPEYPPHHLYPGAPKIPCNPSFKDKIMYDVVVYTNPELSQSVVIYSHKNVEKCRLVLNNFIRMYLNGTKIININKINDEYPIRVIEPYYDHFDPTMPPPPFNPWDKRYRNPEKANNFDIWENFDEPHGRFEPIPPCPKDHFRPLPPVDYTNIPKDGTEVHLNPEPPIYPDRFAPHHHHHHHCPPPPFDPEFRPENFGKIVCYFGNGGFAMGGGVVDSILDLPDSALRSMIEKNYRSTYVNMNPRDTINIKKVIRPSISALDTFEVQMDIAGEWCFFMIPDHFYRMVRSFNWFYKDETTNNQWVEAPLEMSQKTFTIQDNGVRYYINAIKFNGDYTVKFALSSLIPPDPEEPDFPPYVPVRPDAKYRVTIIANGLTASGKYVTILDTTTAGLTPSKLIFNVMDNACVDCDTNVVFALSTVETDPTTGTETSTIVKYFKVVANPNYRKGYSVWTSDDNTTFVDTTSDVVQFTA